MFGIETLHDDDWQPTPGDPVDARLSAIKASHESGRPMSGPELEQAHTDRWFLTPEQEAQRSAEAKPSTPSTPSPAEPTRRAPPAERPQTPDDLREDRSAEYRDRPFHGVDEALSKDLTSIGVTLGVPRAELVAVVGQALAAMGKAEPSVEEDHAADVRARDELRRAWGGAYDKTVGTINEVLAAYPKLRAAFIEARLDQNVDFMRRLAEVVIADRNIRVGEASYLKHGRASDLSVRLGGG